MTIHFAAARPVFDPLAGTLLRRRIVNHAANDNGHPLLSSDTMLRAALKHFAAHGLGAAENARQHAEQAFFAGDRSSYLWWLGICRALDRRLAARLTRSADGVG
jgi:hypothetical protein